MTRAPVLPGPMAHEVMLGVTHILPEDTPWRCAARSCTCPDPKDDRDALIAAAALAHGMTVVTRNAVEFAATCVPVLNPLQPTPERQPACAPEYGCEPIPAIFVSSRCA